MQICDLFHDSQKNKAEYVWTSWGLKMVYNAVRIKVTSQSVDKNKDDRIDPKSSDKMDW